MEVMNKILSESDATNKRLEFPARSLSAFPMPDGQNSVQFVAFDMQEQQWRLKVSIRNEGRYPKPWLKGEWHDYVHQKGLKKGDKVILTVDGDENGERIYRIRAERKLFGFWQAEKYLLEVSAVHSGCAMSEVKIQYVSVLKKIGSMCFVSVGVVTSSSLVRLVLLPL
ncbi:hypothetical protein NC651_026080 [Populus alba x Populus x berolinensis]|nr:hypothetical protein NC651_026080 [Populus alba x Populus x berolinensis]